MDVANYVTLFLLLHGVAIVATAAATAVAATAAAAIRSATDVADAVVLLKPVQLHPIHYKDLSEWKKRQDET